MSIKLTRLTTHWSPTDAHTTIEFLGHLQDPLCGSRGDEIVSLLRDTSVAQDLDQLQRKLEFDNNDEF